MQIINIHSRKGGVGKTSIALSVAAQLAARGRKTAVLDLDMMGTHLANSLPFAKYVASGRRGFEIVTGEPPHSDQQPFGRATLFWNKVLVALKSRGKPIGTTDVLMELQKNKSIVAADVVDEAKKLFQNLRIMPCSCFIRDIDQSSQFVHTQSTRDRFERFLSRVAADCHKDGYDYFIVDNSPGLTLSPGLNLHWTLSIPDSTNKWACHCWFVCGPAPWEPGLTLYEILGLPHFQLQKLASAVLFVNEVDSTYRKLKEGNLFELAACPGLTDAIREIPMWKASPLSGDDFTEKYVTPLGIKVALLGSDPAVPASMRETSDDYGGWSDWTEKFMRDFLLAAVSSRPPRFHQQLRDTAIDSGELLQEQVSS